jgi:hypothetical protein
MNKLEGILSDTPRAKAETDCVPEPGAGYGDFINEVEAKRKIAVDEWDGFTRYLRPEIEGRVRDAADLSFLSPSVNFVFASNLFEHPTQETLLHPEPA